MKKRSDIIDLKKGKRNIWFLGGSSFFNDIGSEMISPLLPFYILSFGGGGVALGLLSGLREGLASLFKLLGGWFSDRIGRRKPFVFLGYFLSTIFRFLLGLAGSWQSIIGLVSLERLGKSRDAPRDAIISVSTKKRGKGFGIQQMLDSSGAVLGSLIVLILFWKFNLDFKTIIFAAAGISILSLVPLFFVKEPLFKPIRKNLFKGIKELNNKLKYFIFVVSVFTLANFGLYFFLILRAKEMSGSFVLPIALYVLFNFVYAFFSIPFGNLSDKIGRKKVLMMGYVLLFFVSLGFIYSDGIIYLGSLFLIYGLVYAIVQPNQTAFVADLSGKMKGTALGFYQMIVGLVSIPAGIIAGLLWNISFAVMFSYIALVVLISIVLLGFVREKV